MYYGVLVNGDLIVILVILSFERFFMSIIFAEAIVSFRFAEERKQFNVRLENERNELERKFANEKMKLINRLQVCLYASANQCYIMILHGAICCSFARYLFFIRTIYACCFVHR